jgi:ATP-dependent DNA ligase
VEAVVSTTLAAKPPTGPDWVHEIKDDGYRLMVRRDGDGVRPFTRPLNLVAVGIHYPLRRLRMYL